MKKPSFLDDCPKRSRTFCKRKFFHESFNCPTGDQQRESGLPPYAGPKQEHDENHQSEACHTRSSCRFDSGRISCVDSPRNFVRIPWGFLSRRRASHTRKGNASSKHRKKLQRGEIGMQIIRLYSCKGSGDCGVLCRTESQALMWGSAR